ncbi:MAG: type VI secretion system tube protein Hcp [Proteobacteria bacterium]|nr:type VI secretion system tube protein Hcp [Pseudomonadota bacterium]
MPIYMQIDNISGSVTAQDYKNWIALKSMDFGADRPISTKPGNVTDRESSKPNINEINITKALDQTTPYIFSEACAGTGKTVKIDICNTGNTPYLELTLSNALVSSHSVASIDNGSTVDHVELMKINFDKIEVRYTPYDEQNNMGSPVSKGYDLATSSKI